MFVRPPSCLFTCPAVLPAASALFLLPSTRWSIQRCTALYSTAGCTALYTHAATPTHSWGGKHSASQQTRETKARRLGLQWGEIRYFSDDASAAAKM